MRKWIIWMMALSLAIVSCKKEEDLSLTGPPSPLGAIGNEFDFTHSIDGIGSVSAEVTALASGISTVEASFEVTNDDLLPVIEAVAALYPAQLSVAGNTVTASLNARFTTDGISWISASGEELVVCKYDASVGDTWTMNVDGKNVKHQVSQRSTEDDYAWGFWLIKVVTMEATGYGLPGLNRVEYISNHKFGPVGIKGYFSGGTTLEAGIFSLFDNE